MGKIYCMMGKSSSGKDTLYQKVLERLPQIHRVVPYTTRPIRERRAGRSGISFRG